MSSHLSKLTTHTRTSFATRLSLQLRSLYRGCEYCFFYLTWKTQMFFATFNSNDGLTWMIATLGTSAFGSPVVLAAIISGIFVVISKLIEHRSKRKSESETAELIKTQNALLEQVLASKTQTNDVGLHYRPVVDRDARAGGIGAPAPSSDDK